ncbi:hypothetical protein AWC38_SpisGene13453 [Stylophora pistillata]|uniref:Uncharacterized protein n=1 Tax=Stylophora pistillata TaxID=50429 RepID=A0A2B4S0D3_STYPI|nr:hypothetical protein AWC38_SpisGene13453 [Stylophora pistillata]
MPTDFRRLFNYSLSPVGTNDREGEELTLFLWWEEMIDQETIPLSKILEFCTGADEAMESFEEFEELVSLACDFR